MTDVPTPRTDAAWRGVSLSVDNDDELAPLRVLRETSRTLEREIAQQAARIDALTKALEALSTPHCILCGCSPHIDGCIVGLALKE